MNEDNVLLKLLKFVRNTLILVSLGTGVLIYYSTLEIITIALSIVLGITISVLILLWWVIKLLVDQKERQALGSLSRLFGKDVNLPPNK